MKKKEFECIVNNCAYHSSNVANFRIHLSRHGELTNLDIKEKFKIKHVETRTNTNNAISMNFDDIDRIIPHESILEENTELENINNNQDRTNYQKSMDDLYMNVYLKYSGKFALPKVVQKEIFDDIDNFISLFTSCLVSYLENNFDKIKSFVDLQNYIKYYSIFSKAHKNFKGEKSKQTWIKQSPLYVAPKEKKLNSKDKFHYVSIIETLKSLLSNDIVYKEYFRPKGNDSNVFTSFETAESYKQNA